MAIGGRYFEMLGDLVKLETAQAREKTARQWNSIQAIDGEVIAQQPRFIPQEADIKADIMPDKNCAIDELQKVRQDFSSFGGSIHHILRNACELHNKGR